MIDIDYTAVRFWLDLLQLIGIVIIGIYAWWQGKSRATTHAIDRVEAHGHEIHDKLSTRLSEHNDRLLTLEQQYSHAPAWKDLQLIEGRFDILTKELAENSAALKATSHLLHLLHTHLLDEGKRKS